MRLSGEAYAQRLRKYSDSTIQLIMDMDYISKEAAYSASEITTNSELTEEQVVAALKRLKHEYGIQ
jgi:hypothetical protein